MSDTLIAAVDLKASLNWLFQDSSALSTITDSSSLQYAATLSRGYGIGQADMLWYDQRSLDAVSFEGLQLSALSRAAFDNTLTTNFNTVKAILLINTETTSGLELTIGASLVQEWYAPFAVSGSIIRLPSNSCLMFVNNDLGWTVESGAHDTLRVTNPNAQSVTYQIVMIGTS
jgi:hypothetical protein